VVLSRFDEWRGTRSSQAIRKRFKIALVQKVPLFADLSPREVTQIAQLLKDVEYPAGTQLVTTGDTGGEMFMIVDGEVIVRSRPGRTFTLKPGDFFGEMSLIDGAPRSATVEAKTPVRLLVIDQRDFWRMLDSAKSIVRKILHILCDRLREADKSASR
jgi:CRP-like cAMP-binding protein